MIFGLSLINSIKFLYEIYLNRRHLGKNNQGQLRVNVFFNKIIKAKSHLGNLWNMSRFYCTYHTRAKMSSNLGLLLKFFFLLLL